MSRTQHHDLLAPAGSFLNTGNPAGAGTENTRFFTVYTREDIGSYEPPGPSASPRPGGTPSERALPANVLTQKVIGAAIEVHR